MNSHKDSFRSNELAKTFTLRDMEELDPSILFQAMVGTIGVKKTTEVLSYYLELKDEIEGSLDD